MSVLFCSQIVQQIASVPICASAVGLIKHIKIVFHPAIIIAFTAAIELGEAQHSRMCAVCTDDVCNVDLACVLDACGG